MPIGYFIGLSGVLGLVFGSFANVVIWRFPRSESLSYPPSHCPSCSSAISWYDNVPVASWLALRARCRSCGEPISARYPSVELLTGLLWAAAAAAFGPTPVAVAAMVFMYLLLILAFIDLDTMRLPNALVALLAAVGLAGALIAQFAAVPVVPLLAGGWFAASPLLSAVVGAVVSGGVALAIASAYAGVRKTQGFGMGDVKLLAAIGLFLGLFGVMVLFVGSVLGALVGIAVARRSEEGLATRYPFGPFLAIAAVIVLFCGPSIWGWYAGLIGLP